MVPEDCKPLSPVFKPPTYQAPSYGSPTYQAPCEVPTYTAPTYTAPNYPAPTFEGPVRLRVPAGMIVGGNPATPTVSDAGVRDRMILFGYDVQLVGDGASTTSDADGASRNLQDAP